MNSEPEYDYEDVLLNGELYYHDLETREQCLDVLVRINTKIAQITSQIDHWYAASSDYDRLWLAGAKQARAHSFKDRKIVEFRIRELKKAAKAESKAKHDATQEAIEKRRTKQVNILLEEIGALLGSDIADTLRDRVQARLQ